MIPGWRQRQARGILVSAVFGFEGHANKVTRPLRRQLYTSCAKQPSHTCTSFAPHPVVSSSSAAQTIRIAQLYFNSTFCLQPWGDGPTRAGIIDALLLGCIPVLFHASQQAQWPRHWGSWARNASLLIDGEKLIGANLSSWDTFRPTLGRRMAGSTAQPDVIALLQAVEQDVIERMQATIRAHAHCLHYFDSTDGAAGHTAQGDVIKPRSAVGDEPDAFDITLRAAWERALLAVSRRRNKMPVGSRRDGTLDCKPVL